MKTLGTIAVVLSLLTTPALAQNPPAAKPSPAPQTAPPISPTARPTPAAVAPPAAPVPATETAGIQEQEAELLKDLPELSPEQVERYVSFQTRTLSRVFGVNLQYEGLLPQIKRADNPLQLINPFAPARYGNAFDNVAVNPVTGRAEGIKIFAVKF
jgi:hypothetical protein